MPFNIQPIFRAPGALLDNRVLRDVIWNRPETGIDGVFEGGSTLGTAYIGTLRALSDNDVWFRRLAGNSAGSITAALIAAGFTAVEMHWLTAGFRGSIPRPSTLPASIREPLNFEKFLDFTTDPKDISQSNKEKDDLWQAFNLSVVDVIKEVKLPIPTQDGVIDGIMKEVKKTTQGIGDKEIRGVLDAVLGFLPKNEMTIGQLIRIDLSAERRNLANKMWDDYVKLNPWHLILMNLTYEGGICEGDVFLKTLQEVLGAKVHGDSNKKVEFKDLKIPLAVIASDIKKHEMVIYSSKKNPTMEVAEAVRRSMSIPFLFDSRGDEIVDGGLTSNYPYWLFTDVGNDHYPPSEGDKARIKMGFYLDEEGVPLASWDTSPAKYLCENGEPVNPDAIDVLTDNFACSDKPNNSELIQRVFDVMETSGVKEWALHDVIAPVLMKDMTFYEVAIPVKGYHWLDFKIGNEKGNFNGIAQRGWYATIDVLHRNNLLSVFHSRPVCPFK